MADKDVKNEELEEENNIIVLTDDEGNDVEFEFIDLVEYKGAEYVVLLPCDEESEDVVILEVEEVNEEEDTFKSVEDEDILNAVFGIFKDKFKDEFNFVD